MTRTLCLFIVTLCLTACASGPAVTPATVADLAPTGKLRAVINLGNAVLAKKEANGDPGVRLLPGRFMVIDQAMGMRLGRAQGANYLTAFVEDMKASGFVAAALRRHAIEGAVVASPGGRP